MYAASACGHSENITKIISVSDALWDNRNACGRNYLVRCKSVTSEGIFQAACKRDNAGNVYQYDVTVVDYCGQCNGFTMLLSKELKKCPPLADRIGTKHYPLLAYLDLLVESFGYQIRMQTETFINRMPMHLTMGTENRTLATDGLERVAVAWSVCKGLPNTEARPNKICELIKCKRRLGKANHTGAMRDSSLTSTSGDHLSNLIWQPWI
ncbi:hypothetical protein KFK09_003015 [Dendrobium nobile]|uniref:Uncharacterized protein n=1 Tax=Dendrobium nobile TaxID=94219 RepID=A0A8T3C6I0_DENNO|nr:hypothetical protein KFK09_003015 [Dendrobium nobile]